MIERRGDLARHVAETIAAGEEYAVNAYVLGIPFNMDGSVGKQVKITRDFGRRLAVASKRPVHEWDERLSSKAADVHLAETGLTLKKRKARRDALAAQIILQTFLDAQKTTDADDAVD
jgi:putative Holliday junction resolvase